MDEAAGNDPVETDDGPRFLADGPHRRERHPRRGDIRAPPTTCSTTQHDTTATAGLDALGGDPTPGGDR